MLRSFASIRERLATSDDILQLSNVQGFHSSQDLFVPGRYSTMIPLQTFVAGCVRYVAAVDAEAMKAQGDQ